MVINHLWILNCSIKLLNLVSGKVLTHHLDADATVKTVYGQQECAEVGYNPHKPGRPSHTYHTYMIANLRLILEVEVQSGKQVASKYSAPGLWELLKRLPGEHWPALIRGDRDWGTEANMRQAEHLGIPYLFYLRLTKGTRTLVERLMRGHDWIDAGQGWQGAESTLRLTGWSRSRRVIVLRRHIKKDLAVVSQAQDGPKQLSFAELSDQVDVYEYSVLIPLLDHEILSIAQLYRDRADAENNFDELKNHCTLKGIKGWGGFNTQDRKRCHYMARITALIYNWWSLFVRLANPNQHTEAVSRPLMLYAIGKQTRHAGQNRLTIRSRHAEAEKAEQCYRRITAFFRVLRSTAEQLTDDPALVPNFEFSAGQIPQGTPVAAARFPAGACLTYSTALFRLKGFFTACESVVLGETCL
jgi:hypothetical protein